MYFKTTPWIPFGPHLSHKLPLTDIIQSGVATIFGEIAFVIVWKSKKPINRLVVIITIT
jgi:hypothetical protein